MRARLRMTSAERDGGAVAVMVALFVTFIILPVAAVSVDLSSAYSNRRQMQNAADAAAHAGAQELVRGASTTAAAVDAAARDIATRNGVDPTDPGYSCEVVKVTYSGGTASVTSPTACTAWAPGAGYNAVRVRAARTVKTFFAPALGLVDGSAGVADTRAGGEAVAAVQKVSDPRLGNSVFAMCAFSQSTDSTTPPLLLGDSTTGWKLNTAAIGKKYVIWSNAGGNSNLSECGLKGEAFDGRICGMDVPLCGQPITLPGRLAIDTGAAVGPVLATMAGYAACQPDAMDGTNPTFSPCAMVIPICYGSNGAAGANGRLDCAAFGEFLMSPGTQNSSDLSCEFTVGSSKTICGKFLGAPQLASGSPIGGDPVAGDPFRIALVQ